MWENVEGGKGRGKWYSYIIITEDENKDFQESEENRTHLCVDSICRKSKSYKSTPKLMPLRSNS